MDKENYSILNYNHNVSNMNTNRNNNHSLVTMWKQKLISFKELVNYLMENILNEKNKIKYPENTKQKLIYELKEIENQIKNSIQKSIKLLNNFNNSSTSNINDSNFNKENSKDSSKFKNSEFENLKINYAKINLAINKLLKSNPILLEYKRKFIIIKEYSNNNNLEYNENFKYKTINTENNKYCNHPRNNKTKICSQSNKLFNQKLMKNLKSNMSKENVNTEPNLNKCYTDYCFMDYLDSSNKIKEKNKLKELNEDNSVNKKNKNIHNYLLEEFNNNCKIFIQSNKVKASNTTNKKETKISPLNSIINTPNFKKEFHSQKYYNNINTYNNETSRTTYDNMNEMHDNSLNRINNNNNKNNKIKNNFNNNNILNKSNITNISEIFVDKGISHSPLNEKNNEDNNINKDVDIKNNIINKKYNRIILNSHKNLSNNYSNDFSFKENDDSVDHNLIINQNYSTLQQTDRTLNNNKTLNNENNKETTIEYSNVIVDNDTSIDNHYRNDKFSYTKDTSIKYKKPLIYNCKKNFVISNKTNNYESERTQRIFINKENTDNLNLHKRFNTITANNINSFNNITKTKINNIPISPNTINYLIKENNSLRGEISQIKEQLKDVVKILKNLNNKFQIIEQSNFNLKLENKKLYDLVYKINN